LKRVYSRIAVFFPHFFLLALENGRNCLIFVEEINNGGQSSRGAGKILLRLCRECSAMLSAYLLFSEIFSVIRNFSSLISPDRVPN
jgi:hypothetical protein